MALSKERKVEETLNGLDLMWKSLPSYTDILFSFRICHDVCVNSELFTEDVILQIDQCAIDFRQLSSDTAKVATRVSDQWLDSAIDFFENMDKFADPSEMLQDFGSQARELARCFKLVAAWARDLAGRLHATQNATNNETKEFQQKFEAAQRQAQSVRDQAKEELDRASKRLERAKDAEEKWEIFRVFLSWIPIADVVTIIESDVAKSKTTYATDQEAKAKEKLREAKEDLERRTSENKRAKFVEEAVNLVIVLGTLEALSEAVAVFWTMEANKFDAQGAKMKTNHVCVVSASKVVVVKNNIAVWKKTKDELDCYATAINRISNCFNFVTEAKPPPAKTVTFARLDFELHLPATIDIEAITDA